MAGYWCSCTRWSRVCTHELSKSWDVYIRWLLKKQLTVKIHQLTNTVSRVDFVFDVYRTFSIKQGTQDSRSAARNNEGFCKRRYSTTKSQGRCPVILEKQPRQNQLFEMLAEVLFENCTKANIVCTKGIDLLCNTSLPTERLPPCATALYQQNGYLRVTMKGQAIACFFKSDSLLLLFLRWMLSTTCLSLSCGSDSDLTKIAGGFHFTPLQNKWVRKHTEHYHCGMHLLATVVCIYWLWYSICFCWEREENSLGNSFPEATSCFRRYH